MRHELPKLVLASSSPRRRELLEAIGVEFAVRPANLDETALPGEAPDEHVLRLAMEKSQTTVLDGELVLAADTVVVIDEEILGKPRDKEEAREMLGRLAGRTHRVFTGVALTEGRRNRSVHRLVSTDVEICPLTEEELRWYVDTTEPLDKAGSYAIQGLGALFVTAVTGNYTNVVGLPLPATQALFRDLGFDLRRFCRDEA